MRRITCILGALVLLGLALQSTAEAATTGNIAGVVTDQASGKALAGVTVTVSGPALQGEQTEFTDAGGRYIITELPPGEYVVRFYFSNIKVERPGVYLNADKTLQVNAAMPTQTARTQTYRIIEKAPTVDVGNTQVQTQVTSEFVKNTPVAGRTYESVLTLAPGAAVEFEPGTGGNQFSFNGATGPENNFLIDGVNTTSPAFGLVGTSLSLEFIKETEIITGGYNAEYGRATGGVVNVVTKSGSNEFHGDAWFYYTPFQLDANRVARIGEAIASTTKLDHRFDFGFDVGGPIVKDRIWFYAGFNPQFATTSTTRILRLRTANQDFDPTMQPASGYPGDTIAGSACPDWIKAQNAGLCPTTPGFNTIDMPTRIPGAQKTYNTDTVLYNAIVKLNFQFNENNSLSVQYLASPSTFTGLYNNLNGADSSLMANQDSQTHDVMLHFISKMLDKKLQLDVVAGFHYQALDAPTPVDKTHGNDHFVQDLNTRSLSLFESHIDPTTGMDPCAPQMVKGVPFNPCPVSRYHYGGLGFYNDTTEYRISAAAGLTYFARLAGTHALKLGGDFEDVYYRDRRGYTGGGNIGFLDVLSDGSVFNQQFATVDKSQPTGVRVLSNGFEATTSTLNESLYLRDSWNVGFLPGLTINAGVRWEAQQVKDVTGTTQISIADNVAPRVGFVYDFTRKGYSKIYASYGRFYESIPLDINDRQFSGEGLALQQEPGQGAWCPTPPMGQPLDPKTCMVPNPGRADLNGGTYGAVSPVLKGMYSNEVVAGLQYDVGLDMVLGAAYIHRDLGRIIEDLSPDGGNNYIIANPGEPTDADTVKGLQDDINNLTKQINATTDPTAKAALQTQKNQKVQTLQLYQGVASFDKPVRDYNALVLTANKRFSHNFLVLASYTYSRTTGNYPGLYQKSDGQLDPNISTQYDLKELLVNRYGPLPNDRPHNLKINGMYMIPIGGNSGFNIGAAFNALSGRPIEVLGRHPIYGTNETFILQRGSGGRTPTITSLDLHLAYYHQFSKLLRLDVVWDIFNLLDEQTATEVDDQYTADRVLPISNGTYADLAHLKTTTGVAAKVNSNYGQPTAYQAPLSMRFGVRVSF